VKDKKKQKKLQFESEKFLNNWQIFIIFLFVGLILNIFSFNAPFIWDDEVVVLGNNVIKNFNNIFSVFKYDLFGERINSSTQFYRPITVASFFIDWAFSGQNPFFLSPF